MLTYERLRELLQYDPETGVFTWLVDRRCGRGRISVRAGESAGCDTPQGYRAVRIDGRLHRAHRLVWLYMTGEWPIDDVDHVNGVRDDNRWSNLRVVDRSTNMQNLRLAHSDCAAGLLGVSSNRNRFKAQISVDGRQIYLGTFDTPEQAHAAYIAAKRRLHPGNTL